MGRLTVKDFITYNNPCFSCDSSVKLTIDVDDYYQQNIITDPIYTGSISPVITNDSLKVDLKITYQSKLTLNIFHKTNKIQTSSLKGLTEYFQEYRLYLRSHCTRCNTQIISNYLDFNLAKGFVNPVSLTSETLCVKDSKNHYRINSYYASNESVLYTSNLGHPSFREPTVIKLPLLPLSKFRDKEHFLDKIKTLVMFS